MRDAFGGVFMMRLMLAFITIFVGFTAVSLNYARAFRVKNRVIDLVEQQQLLNVTDVLKKSKYKTAIDEIVKQTGYVRNCKKETLVDDTGEVYSVCYKGIIIRETTAEEHNSLKETYYKVITYGGWDLSVLNMLLSLGDTDPNSEKAMLGSWVISGEAKVTKYGDNSVPYSDNIKSDKDDGVRCSREGVFVVVIKCQPEGTKRAQCILENGKHILRDDLFDKNNKRCE